METHALVEASSFGDETGPKKKKKKGEATFSVPRLRAKLLRKIIRGKNGVPDVVKSSCLLSQCLLLQLSVLLVHLIVPHGCCVSVEQVSKLEKKGAKMQVASRMVTQKLDGWWKNRGICDPMRAVEAAGSPRKHESGG